MGGDFFQGGGEGGGVGGLALILSLFEGGGLKLIFA